jgi:hypothetical protein
VGFKLTITLILALLFQFGVGQTVQNPCGDGRTIIHSIKTTVDTLLFCATNNFKKDSLTKGRIQTFLNEKPVHNCGGAHPYKCSFGKDSGAIIQYALSYDPKSKLYTEIPGMRFYYWVKGDSIKFSRQLLYKHPAFTRAEIDSVTNFFYNINKKTNLTELRDEIMMLFYCCLNVNLRATTSQL